MATGILEAVDLVVVTRAPGSERATPAAVLAGWFAREAGNILVYEDPTDALRASLAETGPGDVLVVAGSLYLVGWARSQLTPTGAAV